MSARDPGPAAGGTPAGTPHPAAATRASPALAAALARQEERLMACVHCGFCLPACPTYNRLGDEADSPRGRLHLMRAVAEGRLAPGSDAFSRHLDRCLGCRACEPVCPSGVEYGALLETARATIHEARGGRFEETLLLRAFGSRRATRAASLGGRLLRWTRLTRILLGLVPRRAASVRTALAMLEATRAPADLRLLGRAELREPGVASGSAAAGAPSGPRRRDGAPLRVAVLLGCVQEGLYARVNRATERVLRANGCEVVPAPGQGCCGALHAHGGRLAEAGRLAARTMCAFEEARVDAVVVNAAGCGAALKAAAELVEAADGPMIRLVAARVRDVCEFLAEIGVRTGAPLSLRVAYDAPCHLHHGQGIRTQPLEVLRSVPGLEVTPLSNSEECCGGAGTYGLLHPELGGSILGDKLAAIQAADPDVVATGNPGCMMQIGAGLVLAERRIPVVHPVELLDESYRRAGFQPGSSTAL